ncbi:hypothetical protein V1L54_10260 [Streptomyces sp. TRM 70361]|uniref:hypothetical protein n=1 Tax=Streptomyces sp. TRM 70361 TaxID=3116553 RepID=UPI002E7BE5C6|nr:hypothetical protein [Streptomyces sp. TRM 70361]MEE1939783.1 hypothetical protein [Streptomyces sp. TRM 70361]
MPAVDGESGAGDADRREVVPAFASVVGDDGAGRCGGAEHGDLVGRRGRGAGALQDPVVRVDHDDPERCAQEGGELVGVGGLRSSADHLGDPVGAGFEDPFVAFVDEVLQEEGADDRARRQAGHEQGGQTGQQAQADAGTGPGDVAAEIHLRACSRRV